MAPPHESLRLARTYFKLRSPAELRNHSRPVLVQKRFVCHPALESRVIPTLKNKLNAYAAFPAPLCPEICQNVATGGWIRTARCRN
ncbi:protein of unknown function [Bradyrhizobium vignae]|uniref:Uncharacterized protein n=1 Tax=Bradyrhizobium vignae TaxID=1549949 RepID=A0A2U3Q1J3_9BRAD|nr:protein of unknown function [Bradyrhizobium vignae]